MKIVDEFIKKSKSNSKTKRFSLISTSQRSCVSIDPTYAHKMKLNQDDRRNWTKKANIKQNK